MPFPVKQVPVKIIRTLVKKIQSGKNYPNFGKINPLFQKDVKFGKENALQMPYKARYPSFQKCGKEFCPVFDFCFSAIQQHGKNYPNAAKPFKMELNRSILKAVKKIHFIIEFIFLDF